MIKFREIRDVDRLPIKQVLRATKHFTDAEIEIALELVEGTLHNQDSSYQFIVAENGSCQLLGYGCWGEVPLTKGAYDIYWIAVSPENQRKGVGSQLLNYMESQIVNTHGRLILIETSSSEIYQDTRTFYERRGYVLESRIRDFYKPGDDRCIYIKRLDPYD